jgi:hypothetical protein
MTFKELIQKKPGTMSGRLGLVGGDEKILPVGERWRREGGEAVVFSGSLSDATMAAMESVAKGETSILLFDGLRFMDTVRLLDESVSARPLLVMQGIELETYSKILWTGIAPQSRWDNLREVLRGLGILVNALETLGEPAARVALLSCVETISPGIPSTVWQGTVAQMSRRGQLGNAIVDGPLGFDLAVSPEAVREKGVQTSVDGQADLLIPPDLNTYCSLVDALHLSGHGSSAGVVLGAPCPIALPSRYADENDIWLSVHTADLLGPKT